MMKPACALLFVLALIAPAAAQAGKGEMTVVDKEGGMSITRPPDEKWKVENDGKWYASCKLRATHVIDDLSAEAVVQLPSGKLNESWGSVADMGASVIKNYEDNTKGKDGKDPVWKEVKITKKDEKGKFFGDNGSTAAFYFEALVTLGDDAKKELHQWVFIKNNNLYQFVVYGAPGEYQKKIKDINFIIQRFKTFKLEKKK